MRNVLLGLLLLAASTVAAANCTYSLEQRGDKLVQCTTCCVGGSCTTTCF